MSDIIVHATVGPLVSNWVSVEIPIISCDTLAKMTIRQQCRHLARHLSVHKDEPVQLVVKTAELAERLLLYTEDVSDDKLYFVLHNKDGKNTSTTEFNFNVDKFLKEFMDETVSPQSAHSTSNVA